MLAMFLPWGTAIELNGDLSESSMRTCFDEESVARTVGDKTLEISVVFFYVTLMQGLGYGASAV